MSKSFFVILFLVFSLSNTTASKLSDSAEISVLTLGAFEPELFSVFGHSAFRIYDPENKIDLVFNYGVFDFDQPNFYLNFFKGRPYYSLGVSQYPRFRQAYISQDRTIRTQLLNLDSLEKQMVFSFLQNNYRPENRDYVYNYFFDNCATKIVEVLEASLGAEKVILDSSFVDGQSSIRQLMNREMDLQPWGYFGINLFLAGIENTAGSRDYLFLPKYVHQALDNSFLKTSYGTKPLVKEQKLVYDSRGLIDFRAPFFTRAIFLGIIFFMTVAVTARDFIKKRRARFYDFGLFLMVGFIGCLLVYLWFFTLHISQNNWNILWALPTHVITCWFLIPKTVNNRVKKYAQLTFISTLLFCMFLWLIPQGIPWYFIFLILSISIRSWYIWYFNYDRTFHRS